MSHSQSEIIESRLSLSAAIHKEIEIHTHYIKALKNALAAMKMVAAIEQPVPVDQKIIADVMDSPPPDKGFIKSLSDRITHAGNGQ